MSDLVSDRCTCRGGMWKQPDGTWVCRACAKVETEEEHTASRAYLLNERVKKLKIDAHAALKYPKEPPRLDGVAVLEVFARLGAATHRVEVVEAEQALTRAHLDYAHMELRHKREQESFSPELTPAQMTEQRERFFRHIGDMRAALDAVNAKAKP